MLYWICLMPNLLKHVLVRTNHNVIARSSYIHLVLTILARDIGVRTLNKQRRTQFSDVILCRCKKNARKADCRIWVCVVQVNTCFWSEYERNRFEIYSIVLNWNYCWSQRRKKGAMSKKRKSSDLSVTPQMNRKQLKSQSSVRKSSRTSSKNPNTTVTSHDTGECLTVMEYSFCFIIHCRKSEL